MTDLFFAQFFLRNRPWVALSVLDRDHRNNLFLLGGLYHRNVTEICCVFLPQQLLFAPSGRVCCNSCLSLALSLRIRSWWPLKFSIPAVHRRANMKLALCLLVVCAAVCTAQMVFPGRTWERKNPSQVGMDDAKIKGPRLPFPMPDRLTMQRRLTGRAAPTLRRTARRFTATAT